MSGSGLDFRVYGLGVLGEPQSLFLEAYPYLPKPTFLWVLIINPNVHFIGTLQKSRF